LKEGDYLTVSDCIYRARELLMAVGNVSADADPLEDPTLREYIEGVVEERVEQILKEREENDEQPGP
jgi:archaellum component FlaC